MSDIAKLPKWAQEELRRLERALSETRELLKVARGDWSAGNSKTAGLLMYTTGERVELRAPTDIVRFHPDGGGVVEAYVTPPRHQFGAGELYLTTPNGQLSVVPMSSNVILLRVTDPVSVEHYKLVTE